MVITLSFYKNNLILTRSELWLGGNGLQDESRKRGRPKNEQPISTVNQEWNEASRAQKTHHIWDTFQTLPSMPQALLWIIWNEMVTGWVTLSETIEWQAYRVRQTRKSHSTAQWSVTGDIKCWDNSLDKVWGEVIWEMMIIRTNGKFFSMPLRNSKQNHNVIQPHTH